LPKSTNQFFGICESNREEKEDDKSEDEGKGFSGCIINTDIFKGLS
jgi:hypothetical protein